MENKLAEQLAQLFVQRIIENELDTAFVDVVGTSGVTYSTLNTQKFADDFIVYVIQALKSQAMKLGVSFQENLDNM